MGNIFGSKKTSEDHQYKNDEIENLKTRLENIERIDRNNDGLITKNEIDQWITEQKRDLETYRSSLDLMYQEKLASMIFQNEELKKEINALKKINENLENKNSELLSNVNANADKKENVDDMIENVSKEKIDEFVNKILQDENVNIGLMPDVIERQIYRNVFTIILGLVSNMANTTSIKFMDHNLCFNLKPSKET